ncbi:hypothetical protein AB0N17_45125 [Streptomyces sp. NPDC051133]
MITPRRPTAIAHDPGPPGSYGTASRSSAMRSSASVDRCHAQLAH